MARASTTTRRAALRHTLAPLALVALAAGCSSERDTVTEPAPSTTTSTTAPTTTVDQRSPDGANGIKVAADGTLWIASLNSDVILNVDPVDGTILRRVTTPAGTGPDDVVLGVDGNVYFTGFTSGAVGVIEAGSDTATILTNIGGGANPLAIRDDGTLIVGRAGGTTGLWVVDPRTRSATALANPGNLNSFDIADTGVMYAPAMNAQSIVALDPATGSVTETVATLGATPIAMRWSDGAIYALLIADQARVVRVDPATGEVTPVAGTGLAVADNLAVTDDRIYVTGLTAATVTVITTDGTVERTVTIGS